jgi:hypothetical protein
VFAVLDDLTRLHCIERKGGREREEGVGRKEEGKERKKRETK